MNKISLKGKNINIINMEKYSKHLKGDVFFSIFVLSFFIFLGGLVMFIFIFIDKIAYYYFSEKKLLWVMIFMRSLCILLCMLLCY